MCRICKVISPTRRSTSPMLIRISRYQRAIEFELVVENTFPRSLSFYSLGNERFKYVCSSNKMLIKNLHASTSRIVLIVRRLFYSIEFVAVYVSLVFKYDNSLSRIDNLSPT